ncbi:Transcription factor IBH1 [Ananas comosus]|uniref:Transcription factor IBH1 n=1 Tax=Ananas comosus TaxID=4615 RepID=A0A199VH01_ANACO|nr:Transcription factor IBH1 [Ananas comosus]
MLVHHFLRALARVNRTAPKQSHARRSRRIRCAAYASMAAAAGPGRRWSRVLLRRLQSSPSSHRRRISVRVGRPPRIATASSRVETLRRLVPGGRSLGYCSLLEETADYVRWLDAQVQLMQSLVDFFSS